MSVLDSMKNVGKKLRLDSHHMIERFGVMVGILAVTGALLGVSGVGFSIEKNRKQLGSQAVYTQTFKTSKTNIPGEVTGVYSSKDKSKAMVLLKFENVVQVAADAKDYQSFLTAANLSGGQELPKGSPKGSIYVFGTTGYIGVYLVNAGGFDSQVLNLTMRAKSELVVPNSVNSNKDKIDSSFSNFDQWRVYFNPGASEAKHVDSLDGATPDPKQMFYEMVTVPKEDETRTLLDGDLKKMQTTLADVEEKTNRLNTTTVGNTGVKVVAPGAMDPSRVPVQIAGDKVTGKEKTDKAASTLKLESKHTLSGGYDFDWRSGTVLKGYLDAMTPAGMDYVTFLSKKGSEPSESIDVSDRTMAWTLSDGQLLANVNLSNPAYATVSENVKNLTAAYTAYFAAKQTYESNDLPKLLNLEVELRSVEANTTTNTDKNVLLIY